MKYKMSLVSTIRGLLQPLRGRGSARLFSLSRVEPTLPRLLCDSGRAGAMGERQVKNPPRIGRRRSRLDPCSTPPEVLPTPPDVARHLAESSLLLRGLRRENN
jgi:hypothetical protein